MKHIEIVSGNTKNPNLRESYDFDDRLFDETYPSSQKELKLKSYRRRPGEVFDFMRIAFRDFMHTGTIFPSSAYATRTITKHLPKGTKTVVEYGSGNGLLTRVLLEALPEDGKLLAVEINRDFAEKLKQISDPRIAVFEGDIVELSKSLQTRYPDGVNAIVSGIPFSFLEPEVRIAVLENTKNALASGGRFIAYQNSPLIMPLIRKIFPKSFWKFEPRNLPPYFIMVGEKIATKSKLN